MKRWSQIISYNKSNDIKLLEDSRSSVTLTTDHHSIHKTFLENEVNQYLESLVVKNNSLVILKNHKAIIRRDHISLTDQVKILSGGASSYEPLHAEYVGQGLLTAAVMGNINACPSHTCILAVIRELSRNNSSVFVIIMNYASYRLNFGIAIQNALFEGIKVAAVIIEDDCSGIITDKTVGRRTLAGVIFMHKVVGAMAEDKKTLHEIECISKSISKNNLGTINVHMYDGEATLGVGLKGEMGKFKVNYMQYEGDYFGIEDVVQKALSFIVSPASYFSLALKKNDSVAILVNNFRSMSSLDLSMFVNTIVNQVQKIPLSIVSLNFGNYLSSKSILGFSITLFKVNNPRVLKWLSVESLHGNIFTAKTIPLKDISLYINEEDILSKEKKLHKSTIGPKFSPVEMECAKVVLNAVMHEFVKEQQFIDNLDFDHDCGTAMCNFALEVQKKLSKMNIKSPHVLLTSLSEIAAYSMDGLSSGIYSVLFSSAAQAFVRYSSEEHLTYAMWAEAVSLGNKSLCNCLRVEPGCRTIVDSLQPFAEALSKNPADVLTAIEAAEKGVNCTINMTPKTCISGGEQDLMSPDAGAYVFTLAVKTAYYAFISE